MPEICSTLSFLDDEGVSNVSRVVDAEADDEDDAHAGNSVDGEAPVEDVASHVDLKRAEFFLTLIQNQYSPPQTALF